MLYILFGEDDFSLREALEEIKRGLGDPGLLSANTIVLDGQRMPLEQLMAACDAVPFLAPHRLVVVEGLLGTFEKGGGGQEQRQAIKPEARQGLINYIKRKPATTVLILIDSKIKGNNPLLRDLSSIAKVKHFPLLGTGKLQSWIRGRVNKQGGSISPDAVKMLAELVNGDLWVMATEIEKLLLFASGRRIETSDIEHVVSYAQEASIFAMVDSVLSGQQAMAGRLLHQLLDRGATSSYLLAMITRQLRFIVQAKELALQQTSLLVIQSKLGLPSEYALNKTLVQANRYPTSQLRQVYGKLLETDLAIKTGKYSGELALDILIAELCRR